MRFGVLGPLAVWSARADLVVVPEVKVRLLLGMLLAREGRPVSVEALVEGLWGGRRPRDPANSLQTKVSQLRRVLDRVEPGARALVAYGPAGYALRADEVDVFRFRELASTARAELGVGARAALLAEALEWWRGPAFVDFVGEPFAEAAAKRLLEERLSAVEELAGLRVELGEASSVAAELAGLVAEHPLRERMWVVYLRALYRAGRQGEALSGLAEVRRVLAEELGVDPGPELMELQAALLRQDPALSGRSAAEAGEPRLAGANLPVSLTPLVGRDAVLADLVPALRTRRLVSLVGPGGVGKTSLVCEAGRRLRRDVADGVWLVELAGLRADAPDVVGGVEQAVLRVLGVRDEPGERAPGAGGRVGEVLADRELLLVLDNCEHLLDEVASAVGAWLGAAPEVRVVVTSREPLGVPGEVVWPVRPLEEAAAVELFSARASAAAPEVDLSGTEEAQDAVIAVCRRLDGVPLALELAATRVRALGVVELAARLDDLFSVLGEQGLRGGPGRQRTLRAVIDWSWDLLSERERLVLRRLAVYADGFGLASAEEVCAGRGVERGEVVGALSRLVDRSLVVVREQPTGGESLKPRYGLLESVAAYGAERLASAGEWGWARVRFVRGCAELAERAGVRVWGTAGAEQSRAFAELDVEAGNLRAALLASGELRLGEEALRLAGACCWYWFVRGQFREAGQLLSVALAAGEGVTGGSREWAEVWREVFAVLSGESSGAGFARWEGGVPPGPPRRPRPDDDGDGARMARIPWVVAMAYWTAGDLPSSEAWLERALKAFDDGVDAWGVAAARALRGHQRLVRGELVGAAADGRASAEMFGESGEGWGRLWAGQLLGALAEISGDYAEAERFGLAELEVAERLGLWQEVADRLWALGRVAMLRQRFGEARELLGRARDVAAGRGYRSGVIHAESALALCARREGAWGEADALLRGLLREYREIDFAPGEALTLAELGFVAAARGEVDEAWELQARGLDAARRVGDPRGVALALEGFAQLWVLRSDAARAAELLGVAAAARERAGAPLPVGERGDVDRVAAAATAALGAPSFEQAFARGREADLGYMARQEALTAQAGAPHPVPPR